MTSLRSERGQVTVETALAFPVQIVITLAIMQYCLIAAAKQVVNYAAHAAARAVVVGLDPHQAASIICSPIAGTYVPPGAAAPIFIPGRGDLRRSVQSQLKTTIRILNPANDADGMITVEVTHLLEFLVPFVDSTPFNDWHLLFGQIQRLGAQRVVHKPIVQTCTVPQPWDGDLDAALRAPGPHPQIPDLDPAGPSN